jgi:hypothetical protein
MVNENLAEAARAAHDWGLASWLGGTMFGKFALNPSVARIGDHRERGKVVNAAWNGYNAINAVSLGAVALGWFTDHLTNRDARRFSHRERALARAEDGLTLAALATGLASAVEGARLASAAPEGAVPIERGTTPAEDTPKQAARTQRMLGVLGVANIASGVGLVVVNALKSQNGHAHRSRQRRLAMLRRSA